MLCSLTLLESQCLITKRGCGYSPDTNAIHIIMNVYFLCVCGDGFHVYFFFYQGSTGKKLRNQFNFSERASQTYNNPSRVRLIRNNSIE